jgi:hypothetical protein
MTPCRRARIVERDSQVRRSGISLRRKWKQRRRAGAMFADDGYCVVVVVVVVVEKLGSISSDDVILTCRTSPRPHHLQLLDYFSTLPISLTHSRSYLGTSHPSRGAHSSRYRLGRYPHHVLGRSRSGSAATHYLESS